MERLIWYSQTENFQKKRDFLKGGPRFPNGISIRKMCMPFTPCCYYTRAFLFGPVPVEMSVEIVHAHPMEISIRSFDASH